MLGLAAATAELGQRAETSGSAIGRAFIAIDAAVRQGGESLQDFADIAGTTVEEFAGAYEGDAVAGLELFLAGLGRINAEGGSAVAALESVGLASTENIRVLQSLGSRYEIVARDLKVANAAYESNIALNEEAEAAGQSLSARVTLLSNAFDNLANSAGESGVSGALKSVVDTAAEVINIIAGVESALQEASLAAEALVGVIGLLTAAATLKAIKALASGFVFVALNIRTAATAAQLFSATALPLLTIVGAIGVQMWQAADRAKTYRENLVDLRGAVEDLEKAEQLRALGMAEGDPLQQQLRAVQAARAANMNAALSEGSLPGVPGIADVRVNERLIRGQLIPGEKIRDADVRIRQYDQEQLEQHLAEVEGSLTRQIALTKQQAEERRTMLKLQGEQNGKTLTEAEALAKALQIERERSQLQQTRRGFEAQMDEAEMLRENIYLSEEAYQRLARQERIQREESQARMNIESLMYEARATGDQDRLKALQDEWDALKQVTAELLKQNGALDDLVAKRQLVLEFQDSFVDGLSDIITGSESAADAFEAMARRMIAAMTELILKRALMDLFFGDSDPNGNMAFQMQNVGGGSPNARGGYFDGSGKRFASGGIVGSPTNFLYAGGMGIMGEAGPEAIMPIGRDSKGNLGVKVAEGGSSRPNITVQMTVNATDADSFRRSRGQIINDLERATTRLNRNTL